MPTEWTSVMQRPKAYFRRFAKHNLALCERRLFPYLPMPRYAAAVTPPIIMLLIYRQRHVHLVRYLVSEAESLGIRIFLWALGNIDPFLEPWTVGCGPGTRSVLLNDLLSIGSPSAEDFVLICDDDVRFVVGGLANFIGIARAGNFMLAQPTHTHDSFYTFHFTCGHPLMLARSTLFVEIGPMVLVHPEFRNRVFPMDKDLGMGWAEAIHWHKRIKPHERFGMIDGVQIQHVSPVGVDYETITEQGFLDVTLQREGLRDVQQMFGIVDRWYRWQAVPPWEREKKTSTMPLAPHQSRENDLAHVPH